MTGVALGGGGGYAMDLECGRRRKCMVEGTAETTGHWAAAETRETKLWH
jgi:hypothetical protein